jgi:hypothetical protein
MLDTIRRGKTVRPFKTIEALLGHAEEDEEAAVRVMGGGSAVSQKQTC